jgi:ribosome-binding factor A
MHEQNQRATLMLQELAAKFIQHEANTNPLITITSAHASPDFKNVTIFFTTIPEEKQADAHIFLKRNAGEFKNYIKKHGRFKMIPHINFEIDYGERHRQHIDEVVRDIEGEENR